MSLVIPVFRQRDAVNVGLVLHVKSKFLILGDMGGTTQSNTQVKTGYSWLLDSSSEPETLNSRVEEVRVWAQLLRGDTRSLDYGSLANRKT